MSNDFKADTGNATFVRVATEADLADVVAMYGAVCEAMRGTPNDVAWEMGSHPTERGLLDAILAGEMLLALTESCPDARRLLGAAIVSGKQEHGYEHASWTVDAAPEQVGVIHLLATAPWARGAGVGVALVEAAAAYAKQGGRTSLRLDVWPNNGPARAMYERCGMIDKGVHALRYDDYPEETWARLMELPLA